MYVAITSVCVVCCNALNHCSTGFDLKHWRIPGVLQRFGVSYFAVAMTELLCTRLYPRLNVSCRHSTLYYHMQIHKNICTTPYCISFYCHSVNVIHGYESPHSTHCI